MNNVKLRMVGLSVGLVGLFSTASAFAQDNAAPPPPPPPPAAEAQANANANANAQVGMGLPGAAPQTTLAAPAPGGTDHSLVVGHLGFGYMGRPGIAVGSGALARDVNAPVIGVRYWLDPGMGIDVGLGFGIESGSTTAGGASADNPSYWAFVVHGGVPLALANGRHYSFQIIPEANIGLGGGSADNPSVSSSGFLLDLGARAGAEIQFGFIGLPELSLQGSIGASFAIASQSSTPDGGDKNGTSSLALRTTVYNSPWALFTNSVTALYYF